MKAKITINAKLPGLNDYILDCRRNAYSGAQTKRIAQELCMWCAKQQCKVKFKQPVRIHYVFFEPDRRRDKSNVAAFAVKVIEDALVKLQIIRDDGWKYIENYTQSFKIDKEHPHIEVYITDEWQEEDGNESPKM